MVYVPQGSILGPLSFFFYVIDFDGTSSPQISYLFVDDTKNVFSQTLATLEKNVIQELWLIALLNWVA